MINIGVIGVGYLGRHHARIYSELEDVRLSAIVDTNKKQALEISRQYGGEVFTDYKKALNKADAFSIATPTFAHYKIAKDCISAKKHILIEKPITVTVKEADMIISFAKAKNVIVQVGLLERFNPAVSIIMPMVKTPIFIEAQRLSPFQSRGIDVDITLDLMIHDIDIVLSIAKKNAISNIKAFGLNLVTDKIDMAKALIEFEDGLKALFTASRVSDEKLRQLTIYQKNSWFVLNYQSMEIKRYFFRDGEIISKVLSIKKKEPLKEEIKHFVECIKKGKEPNVTAIAARDALKIALEISDQIRKQGDI